MQWIRSAFVVACVGLAASSLGCQLDETDKANKNVNEANDFLKEDEKLYEEAVKVGATGDKDACNKKFDEAIEKIDKAAKLTKDASAMKVTKVFKEYLEVKSNQFAKQSELRAKEKAALCNPTSQDAQNIMKDAEALHNEVKDLADKADKIQKDNADQFKKE